MRLDARIQTLRLAETFRIARSSQDEAETSSSRSSTTASRATARPRRSTATRSRRPPRSRTRRRRRARSETTRSRSTRSSTGCRGGSGRPARRIDGALHDLQGKLLGVPTWRQLGLRRGGPPTSWTLGIADPDETARKAEERAGRFRRFKLKLGAGDGLDVERVRAVRGVTDVPLQVDVNEYWSLDEALDAIPQLAELGVEYVEQPLRAGEAGGEDLRRRSPLPVYVDEDCHTLEDVAACGRIAHGINIKLAKSGGLREAVRMAHAARALGLGVMLGCMVESGLGIAAGAQMGSLCDHVDLDGNLLLAEDPWPGVELVDGVQTPADAPGLGVAAKT